jgi:hypothetical protein
LSPEWLGIHLLGTLFSSRFCSQSLRTNGRFTAEDFAAIFPEVTDPGDLLQILETLQASQFSLKYLPIPTPFISLCSALFHGGCRRLRVPGFHFRRNPKRHLAAKSTAVCLRRIAGEAGQGHGADNAVNLPPHPDGYAPEHARFPGDSNNQSDNL